jgi:hypothetical protein
MRTLDVFVRCLEQRDNLGGAHPAQSPAASLLLL